MSKREYGTGSIYFSEQKNKWIGQIRTSVDADGKKKKRTVYGKTKKEVKEKLKKIQAEIVTGTYVEPTQLTIPHIAHSLNDNKLALNIIKSNTYNRNEFIIHIIEDSVIGKIPVQKLSEPVLTTFLANLTDYSNSTIKKVYNLVNTSLKKAVKMGILNYNPIDECRRPNSKKIPRKVRSLTIEEERQLIAALNTDRKEPYRTMLLLSLFTGMRMGEVCALYPKDILVKISSINVSRTMTRDADYKPEISITTKTYAGLRRIKTTAQVQKLLQDYQANHYKENRYGLLFVAKNGSMITTNQVNSYYKRLVERYGIADAKECNQHQLRHTYATRCIEAGTPAKVLQHQLGHADISTTLNTYCDVFDNYSETYVDKTENYLLANSIAI
ncbi:MAG: tyrosine-type recombinase/integrase [Eubacterium sp.]